MIIFNNPGYQSEGWHNTLFLMACLLPPLVLNLYFKRAVNMLETIGGIMNFLLFVGVIVWLVVVSERTTPTFVFETVYRDAGWDNPVVAVPSVCLLPCIPLVALTESFT